MKREEGERERKREGEEKSEIKETEKTDGQTYIEKFFGCTLHRGN
jgi:hypothetical protein